MTCLKHHLAAGEKNFHSVKSTNTFVWLPHVKDFPVLKNLCLCMLDHSRLSRAA